MRYKMILPLLGTLLFVQTACNNDGEAPTFEEDMLVGRWEITEAYRNGKKTETLTDTFYEFDQEGNMRTNLNPTAMAESYKYDFDGQKIQQKGGTETEFSVEALTDSSLNVSMKINNIPFRLALHKVVLPDSTMTEEGVLQ